MSSLALSSAPALAKTLSMLCSALAPHAEATAAAGVDIRAASLAGRYETPIRAYGFRCKFGPGKTISLGFGGPNSTRTACIATLQNVGSMFADTWHLSTSSGCSFHWKGSNTVEVSLR